MKGVRTQWPTACFITDCCYHFCNVLSAHLRASSHDATVAWFSQRRKVYHQFVVSNIPKLRLSLFFYLWLETVTCNVAIRESHPRTCFVLVMSSTLE